MSASRRSDEGAPAGEIYRTFRGLIVSGGLGAGERLPTIRQTARDWAVSPGTAAKAYRLLEQEGLVVTRTAAGTRVAASAARLPGEVAVKIRDLVAGARAAGVEPEDVIDVLRVAWQHSAREQTENDTDSPVEVHRDATLSAERGIAVTGRTPTTADG